MKANKKKIDTGCRKFFEEKFAQFKKIGARVSKITVNSSMINRMVDELEGDFHIDYRTSLEGPMGTLWNALVKLDFAQKEDAIFKVD